MKIFVVIPAYNEAKNISRVLDGLLAKFSSQSIIVVDDCSKDQTKEIAKSKGVIVLSHLINRGYGAALKTGSLKALAMGAEVVVHFDGDGQFKVDEIFELVKLLETKQVDVVLGSRFLDKSSNVPFLKKWLIHKPALILHRLILGLPLTDVHNGFRVFNKIAAQKIFNDSKQERMAMATEVLQLIKKHNLKMAESGVTVSYEEFGQTFWSGFKIFKDLLWRFFIK